MVTAFFLAAAVAVSPAAVPDTPSIYRVELAGNQNAWAMGKPQPNGPLLLFRHYPDGALMSVRAKDVKRIVVWGSRTAEAKGLKPGQAVEIGATGGGLARGTSAGGNVPGPLRPGERRDGTAVLNPNRPYNPTWDSKLVPGASLPYPAAPNDYLEGKTFAYPPAPAVQAAPGDVPRAPQPNPQ